jgi:outer membrane protein TolC
MPSQRGSVRVRVATLAALAACLIAAPGSAALGAEPQDAADLEVSLADAVALAVEQHPTVARAREEARELEGQIRESRARALPLVEANASVTRARDPALLNSPQFAELSQSDFDFDGTVDPALAGVFDAFRFDPSPLTLTTYYYGVFVEQTIYAFGKVRAGIEATETLRRRARALIRDAEVAASADAARALFDLALAEARTEVLAAERRSRESQLRQAEDFLEIGTGTRLQVLQARSGLAQLRTREIAAEGEVERARAALNETLGRPPLAAVRAAPGVLEDATLDAVPGADALLARAARRPDLAALAVEREALGLQAEAARAERLPEISFSGNYGVRTIFEEELINRDFSAWDAGVYLTWKIYDGSASRGLEQQIASQRAQNEIETARRLGEIGRDVVTALLEYRRARDAAEAADVAVEATRETLRVAEEESRWGAATALDVLDAQQSVTSARFDRLQAVRDALVASVDLKSLVGVLPTEELGDTP